MASLLGKTFEEVEQLPKHEFSCSLQTNKANELEPVTKMKELKSS